MRGKTYLSPTTNNPSPVDQIAQASISMTVNLSLEVPLIPTSIGTILLIAVISRPKIMALAP